MSLEIGDGGAQLVGHIADELHAPLLGGLKGAGHLVEALGQLPQLVGLTGRYPPCVTAG